MSLVVWLPLTKDLRQQGLSDVTVTNNGATFNSVGKLGGCYYFNRSSSNYLKINNPLTSSANGVSMAFWVKLPSNGSVNDQLVHIGNGSGWTNNRFTCFVRGGNSTLIFCCGDGTNSTQYNCVSSALTLNQWTHVTCIYRSNKMMIYLNGSLDKEYNTNIVPSFTNVAYIGVGAGPNITEPATAYLNDVRIYDHALSQMEVKELAKGLVLHYPLNRNGWGQENLLSGNNAKITTWTNYMPDSVTLTGEGYDNKYTLIKGIGGWEKIFTDAIAVTNGEIYTLSFDYSVEQNYTGYSGQFGLSICTTSQAQYGADSNIITKVNFGTVQKDKNRTSVTFTATSDVIYLVANGGYINDGQENISFYISYLKLEKGSIATPWCPNSSDALATTMGLNSTTEYDCSGFCNNGTRTGTFDWTSDTPKYSVSTTFGGSQYITEDNEIETTDSTIAAWVKTSLSANAFILDCRNSSGAGKQPIYQYTNGSIQSGGASQYVTTNTGLLVANTWIHLAIVQSGSSLLVYKNGSLFQTLSCTNSPIIKPTVGARYSLSSLLPSGSISDIRIYATALSADDVKSLYQNSAYIDSSGNVYGAVHTEV